MYKPVVVDVRVQNATYHEESNIVSLDFGDMECVEYNLDKLQQDMEKAGHTRVEALYRVNKVREMLTVQDMADMISRRIV